MKDYERLHTVRVEEGQTCPHCKNTGHTEEKCWPLHPELAVEHLQEKVRNVLKSQARDALARIGSMTVGVRRTFIG
jgi:hypothetical protein